MYPQLPCISPELEDEGIDNKHINNMQLEFRKNNGATADNINDATKEANNLNGFNGGSLVSELARLKFNLGLTQRHHINSLIRQSCDANLYGYVDMSDGELYLPAQDGFNLSGGNVANGDNGNTVTLIDLPCRIGDGVANEGLVTFNTPFGINGNWYILFDTTSVNNFLADSRLDPSGLSGMAWRASSGDSFRVQINDGTELQDVTFTLVGTALVMVQIIVDLTNKTTPTIGLVGTSIKLKFETDIASIDFTSLATIETHFAGVSEDVVASFNPFTAPAVNDFNIVQTRILAAFNSTLFWAGDVADFITSAGHHFHMQEVSGNSKSTDGTEEIIWSDEPANGTMDANSLRAKHGGNFLNPGWAYQTIDANGKLTGFDSQSTPVAVDILKGIPIVFAIDASGEGGQSDLLNTDTFDNLKEFGDIEFKLNHVKNFLLFQSSINIANNSNTMVNTLKMTNSTYNMEAVTNLYMLQNVIVDNVYKLENLLSRSVDFGDFFAADAGTLVDTDLTVDTSSAGNTALTVDVKNSFSEIIQSKSLNIRVSANPSSILDINFLFTGNSLITNAASKIVGSTKTKVASLTSGTVTDLGLLTDGGFFHEGVGGKTGNFFINVADPSNNIRAAGGGVYDVAAVNAYITTNFSTEWVVGAFNVAIIVLFTNEVDQNLNDESQITTDVGFVQTMATAWATATNTDHVLVLLPNVYGPDRKRFRFIANKYIEAAQGITGVTFLNTHLKLTDDIPDYAAHLNVHPSPAGFDNITTEIQGWFSSVL